MGLLDTLERSIEKVVRGAFSGRGGSVGPVEIATAVRRHMDRETSTPQRGVALVPNLYKIRLSEHDFTEAKNTAPPWQRNCARKSSGTQTPRAIRFRVR